jgi:hypothetical protein
MDFQTYLKTLLAKHPSAITPAERAFMKARIAYIGNKSRKKFARILR